MTGGTRWLLLALVLGLAGLSAGVLPLAARQKKSTNPNEIYVKRGQNVQDADASRNAKLWVMDFKFKSPRLIKVNIPGKGQRLCWYMWYQVINYTGQPRTFIPEFELVTRDTNMSYRDQVLPTAQAAIMKVEDPTNFDKIKNSVTIAANPIPVSKPKATPRPVTGVAIWIDPNEPDAKDSAATRKAKAKMPKLLDSNKYDVFVAGLSNGWALTDAIKPDAKQIVRRKTLQLGFTRKGDKYLMKSEHIKFDAPAQWIYRASSLKVEIPGQKKKADAPADKKK